MGKKKILILAVCAVVVIAGAVAATTLLRDGMNTAGDVTTTTSTTVPQTEYDYNAFNPVDTYEPATVAPESTTNNNLLTTLRNIATTTKKTASKTTTKKRTTTTTKKNSSTQATVPPKDGINIKDLLANQQVLGYRYEPNGDYYYTDDKDCWQSNAGYNEIYDNMAGLIMMNIDQVRIRFTYEKKDWMIQLWKGQYGNLLIGAEIGVYTADEGSYDGDIGDVNHYNCADKEDWLKMEMTCYWKENNEGSYKKAFSREYDYYWWATGFVKGQLTKYTTPRTELKLKARITFKSTEMANLFVQGMKESGFARALGSNQLVDDSFYQKDADVWFLWTTKYHDAFVGYEG